MPDQRPFEALHYVSADGELKLFARDYAAAPNGAGKLPLLMMHGLTRNSADFEPLIRALRTDRRVIVPDQRGRGLSQYDPDPGNYRPDVYAADMWTLLDRCGVDKVVCVGTSMGGLISMVMGAQEPARIAGIVLNDVGAEVNVAGLARIGGYVGTDEPMADWSEAVERCREINASALDGMTDRDWLDFARRTCRELADGRIEFAYDPAISQGVGRDDPATVPPDLWPLWEALTDIPVLVIRGQNSDILLPETVSRMGQKHAGSFQSIEIPGRGHAPILDEALAVSAIEDFLASHG